MLHKYSKTRQFRDIVKEVQHQAAHLGTKAPILQFRGTVKLHGSNTGIGFNTNDNALSTQSREQELSLENDFMGFTHYVEDTKVEWTTFLHELACKYETCQVMVYGEWVGKGVQNTCAINETEVRYFFPFSFKALTGVEIDVETGTQEFTWKEIPFKEISNAFEDAHILNALPIEMFKCFNILIDFENPHLSINTLDQLTKEVEDECPVAKAFRITGIGEGIVWHNEQYGYRFKTKGEKHSVTKVKTLAVLTEEDIARINTAGSLADTLCTQARLEQGIHALAERGLGTEMKNIGEYLKWINKDIMSEEGDLIEALGGSTKLLNTNITKKAKQFYMSFV